MAAAKKAKKAAPKKAAKKKVFQIHNSGAAPQGSAPVLSARRRLHVAVVGFAVGFIEQCLTSSNDAVPMMTVLDCNHPTSFDRFRGPQQHGTYCPRSEEHTSELQSLMRISYAVFCLKTKHTTL